MNFSDIPQFPRANYSVDVSWAYLEEHIATAMEGERPLNLDPDFQRGHVWTTEQQQAYVEYILHGGEVSNTLYFNAPHWKDIEHGPYEIVDGKQRLEAARKFLRNELPAFGRLCKEFSGRLSMTGPSFKWSVLSLSRRSELLHFYLSINTRGTPHSEQEIERVSVMYLQQLLTDVKLARKSLCAIERELLQELLKHGELRPQEFEIKHAYKHLNQLVVKELITQRPLGKHEYAYRLTPFGSKVLER